MKHFWVFQKFRRYFGKHILFGNFSEFVQNLLKDFKVSEMLHNACDGHLSLRHHVISVLSLGRFVWGGSSTLHSLGGGHISAPLAESSRSQPRAVMPLFLEHEPARKCF